MLLLCVSPHALASGWVALERSTAIHRDPANEGRRFIPLLLSDCDLPDTLRRYKYVDWRGEAESAFAELLEACRPDPTAEPVPARRERKTEPLAVLERKLTGHGDFVWSVTVSPDGKWAASGSGDQTVKVWDLESGECRATLAGHTDRVNSVAITAAGTRVLSGSNDHTIRVWDAEDGKSLAGWQASKHYVLSVVPMADGRRVITAGGSTDRALKLWDIATQNCLRTLGGHTAATRSVSLARNQIRAVSGSNDQTLRLWNLESGELKATLEGHPGPGPPSRSHPTDGSPSRAPTTRLSKSGTWTRKRAWGRWRAIRTRCIRWRFPPTVPGSPLRDSKTKRSGSGIGNRGHACR